MRRRLTPQKWLSTAVAGLALAFSTSSGRAATDYVIQTFDADVTSAHDDGQWPDGSSSKTIEWSAIDAGANSASGSMQVTIRWSEMSQVAGWEDSKLGITSPGGTDFTWPGIDCRPYINLEWDVKIDPANSYPAVDGTYGGIEVIFQGWEGANGNPAGLNWTSIGKVNLDNTNGWQHKVVSLQIYPYTVNRLVFNFNVNPGTNKITYLVDNITLTAPPAPPPTLALVKPVPGLALVAASGGQWDRQEIRTAGTNYSWVGASGPVSYSFDVAQQGDSANPGLQLFMMLVPGIPDPARGDSDWHETNVVLWSINNNADGSAWSTLRYKTNAPDSNGHLFDTGDLGGVGNATCAGTWTIRFEQNTNITITTPSGGTLTTNLPPEVVTFFGSASTNMQINIGIMPGDPARVGQQATVTRAKITGTPFQPNVDSSFLGQPLDTNVWTILAAAKGVQSIPADAAYWVNWTLPANGFELQDNATLAAGTWTSSTNVASLWGGMNHVLFHQAELPGVNSGYFRMVKRTATKLQILLPGETSAPGTPTGKKGTPIHPLLSTEYTILVNAVDNDWNIVRSVNDAIAITSDESSATLPAVNPTLNSGTATVLITLNQQGPWTITATDVTDPAKTDSTVSVTVQ